MGRSSVITIAGQKQVIFHPVLLAKLVILDPVLTVDLPAKSFVEIGGAPLRALSRELVLAWNPRLVRVRPAAGKLLGKLEAAFAL